MVEARESPDHPAPFILELQVQFNARTPGAINKFRDLIATLRLCVEAISAKDEAMPNRI